MERDLIGDWRLSRRAALGTMAALAHPTAVRADVARNIKAIAFDAFVIFDQRSIAAAARELFPDKGDALVSLWLPKLFGYTWLVTSAGRYDSFASLADRSLTASADALKLNLTKVGRETLVGSFARLEPWPDVKPAVDRLRQGGIKLVLLSNLGEEILAANMARAGLAASFERPLSTDRVRQFKPAPPAYNMAIDALGLPREAIGFAAFGGWDAAGATWFGYRTAWINRFGVPADPFDPSPAIVSRTMDGVLKLAGL